MKKALHINRDRVAVLLATHASRDDIAKTLNISRRTVDNYARQILPTVSQVSLARAQELIEQRASLESRVDRLASIIRAPNDQLDSSGHRFASLNALRYANEISGIHPQLDLDKASKEQEAERTIQPLFVLPANTSISVTVSRSSDNLESRTLTIKPESE